MSALWLGGKGTLTAETVKLFLIGLPFLIAGTWFGLKLFGRLNEAAFRKLVLMLVLASDRYDPGSYIRDYSEFLELVKAASPA